MACLWLKLLFDKLSVFSIDSLPKKKTFLIIRSIVGGKKSHDIVLSLGFSLSLIRHWLRSLEIWVKIRGFGVSDIHHRRRFRHCCVKAPYNISNNHGEKAFLINNNRFLIELLIRMLLYLLSCVVYMRVCRWNEEGWRRVSSKTAIMIIVA